MQTYELRMHSWID